MTDPLHYQTANCTCAKPKMKSAHSRNAQNDADFFRRSGEVTGLFNIRCIGSKVKGRKLRTCGFWRFLLFFLVEKFLRIHGTQYAPLWSQGFTSHPTTESVCQLFLSFYRNQLPRSESESRFTSYITVLSRVGFRQRRTTG